MADNTSIEWTDATWNVVTGCSVVSPGCTNCYAMKLAGTRLKHHPSRAGLTVETKAGPVWNGQVRLNESWLDQPLRWRRPRRIFVCAHGDLFHESVPDDWIDRVFAVMALAPRHTFQVLTKRAARMREYMVETWQGTPAQTFGDLSIPAGGVTGRRSQIAEACESLLSDRGLNDPDNDRLWTVDGACKAMQWQWPLPNVWLGVSVEDQARADERIPDLLATPASVRFVSAEPLLGPIDLTRFVGAGLRPAPSAPPQGGRVLDPPLHWVIAGGESGPGARPMHPAWARSLRDQCQVAGVPFFFKQWGEWVPAQMTPIADAEVEQVMVDGALVPFQDFGDGWVAAKAGKRASGRLLDGRDWNEFPR